MFRSKRLLFALLVFSTGIVYFGCSGDPEEKCVTEGTCEGLSSTNPSGESSSSQDPENPGDNSSDSSEPNESSSGATTPGESSSSETIGGNTSSSNGGSPSSSSSEYHPPTPIIPGENCAYMPILCGGIAFEDVIVSEDYNFENEDIFGQGPTCLFAASITKLGNENGVGDGLKVNGVKLVGNNDANVNGRCGNTDWGQQACADAIKNVAKIDGGYYIYAPGWVGMVNIKGGEPVCGSGNASSSSRASSSSVAAASSSSRASSSSVTAASSSSRASSSSVVAASSSSRASSSSIASSSSRPSSSSIAGTLTCANVPSAGTAGQAITPPAVNCNGNLVTGTNLGPWSGTPNAPNWNSPVAGTYSNIRASVATGATGTAQACRNLQATCSGTLVVSNPAPPSQPSSSSQGGGGGSCETCVASSQLNRTGKTTRYWDGCKPSCAWPGKNTNGQGTAKTCNISGGTLSDANASSSCQNGPAFTCMNQAPWQISDNIAYGFAASHSDADCGKCFQLEFTSNGEGGTSGGNVSGKTLVVMISNIGGDVGGDQFDLMIPGGGVGQFDAISRQLSSNGVSGASLGAQYGGFRATCGNDASCVTRMCNNAFSTSALADMKRGCEWYVEWMKIANNPTVKFKDIPCPAALKAKW